MQVIVSTQGCQVILGYGPEVPCHFIVIDIQKLVELLNSSQGLLKG